MMTPSNATNTIEGQGNGTSATTPTVVSENQAATTTPVVVSDNQAATSPVVSDVQDIEQEELAELHNSQVRQESTVNQVSLNECEQKSKTLASFIVLTLIGQRNGRTDDKVEETLLRCVNSMLKKHEILFKGMTKRLEVTPETGYTTFTGVANELFEGESLAVSWGRIVALYSFGGSLAMDCKEKKMEDLAISIATFMGRYASEVVAPFVERAGGWEKLCEKFPVDDDLENQAWNFLTWTAIGLGIVSAVTFFTKP